MEIEALTLRLKSFTNIKRQQVVFYGDECIATLELINYPKGRIKPYELVSTKKKIFENAYFYIMNKAFWKEREIDICRIEIILQLIRKNNLWRYLDTDVV